MKSIFKILLLIFALIALFIQCKKEDPEPDPWVEIPDVNFLNALIERGVDSNFDSIISPEEAEVVTYLNVSLCDISDLSGIQKFINLETLVCGHNHLTTLDISNNICRH